MRPVISSPASGSASGATPSGPQGTPKGASSPPAFAGSFAASGLTAARGGVALSIPLPFLLAGVVCAALFGLLVPFVAPEALVSPLFPHVLALVHLATLGWLTMTIMGASLQLTPVILNAPLRATRLLRWQFPVYVVGLVLLISGFAAGRPVLLATGGVVVVLAVLHYAFVLAVTLFKAPTRPLTARYLIAALTYLCVVVGLGLTAALNMQLHFLGDAALRLLQAHVALALLGWLSTTLLGVSYTLVRLFALVHGHADAMGRRIFVALNAGVLGLAAGLMLDWSLLVTLAGLALTFSIWLFGYDYLRMLRMRRRKLLDMTQRHALAGVAYLALTVPLALAAALTNAARPPQIVALGLLMLVGALGQSIIGYLYKIVPFLMWHTRYAPQIGKTKVPLMRDLIDNRAALATFWLINLGLPAAALAATFARVAALQVTGVALGLGLAIAAVNIVHACWPR